MHCADGNGCARGIVLITRDVTGKSLPKWLSIGHGLIAIAGFVFLLMLGMISGLGRNRTCIKSLGNFYSIH
jgi:hypothetical protein